MRKLRKIILFISVQDNWDKLNRYQSTCVNNKIWRLFFLVDIILKITLWAVAMNILYELLEVTFMQHLNDIMKFHIWREFTDVSGETRLIVASSQSRSTGVEISFYHFMGKRRRNIYTVEQNSRCVSYFTEDNFKWKVMLNESVTML